jgi:CDP-diacylglycerol--glycerol-3-phosphate 3-phosphatidyltransferase
MAGPPPSGPDEIRPLHFHPVAVPTVAPPLTQVPNALTLARFALIPVFVVLVLRADAGHSVAAGLVFGAAAVTDQIDGYLARRWRVESEFGKYADPLADRLMIDAAVILLWLEGRLPWLALAIIVVRDAVLVGGSRFAVKRGYAFEVSPLGKTATWILYASLFCVLLTPDGTDWPLGLFWAGLGLAVVAGALYVRAVLRIWR